MGVVIAAAAVGLLLVGVGVLLGRRMRERSEPIFGTPMAASSPPTTSPARDQARDQAGAQPGVEAGLGFPSLDRLAEGFRAATADGDLTDEEIQQLLPGAEVTRQADGTTMAWSTASTSHSVQGPDGRTYDSIDDIPDPEVRERLRRMLGDLGK